MLVSDRYKSLSSALPKGKWELWAFRTQTKKCRRLVFTKKLDSLDSCSVHFFLLKTQGIFALALEVYVFFSNEYNTIFVSKADTSGFAKMNAKGVIAKILQGLIITAVPANRPVRICLSAKAQPQYLFARSSENPLKHLLNDQQLIRWWVQTLDLAKDDLDAPVCRLWIPGLDEQITRKYLPAGWEIGDIYSVKGQLALKCIPRFPDDPKTRFMDDIYRTKRAKKVDCDQFWLEIADRQEFNLQRTLGILGIEGLPHKHEQIEGSYSIPFKQYAAIKDVLASCNWSTKEFAKEASAELEERLPDLCIELEGTWVPERATTPAPDKREAVNILDSRIVKRKKKA